MASLTSLLEVDADVSPDWPLFRRRSQPRKLAPNVPSLLYLRRRTQHQIMGNDRPRSARELGSGASSAFMRTSPSALSYVTRKMPWPLSKESHVTLLNSPNMSPGPVVISVNDSPMFGVKPFASMMSNVPSRVISYPPNAPCGGKTQGPPIICPYVDRPESISLRTPSANWLYPRVNGGPPVPTLIVDVASWAWLPSALEI